MYYGRPSHSATGLLLPLRVGEDVNGGGARAYYINPACGHTYLHEQNPPLELQATSSCRVDTTNRLYRPCAAGESAGAKPAACAAESSAAVRIR